MGARELERPERAAERDTYEAAIGTLLGAPQHCAAMDDPVDLYFSDRYKPLLAEACGEDLDHQSTESIGHMTVLDAACWRRAQELIAELPPQQGDDATDKAA